MEGERIRRRLALRAAATVLVLSASVAGAQPATVVLVRHAEKAAAPASDPPLSEAGEARAQALAVALADARVGAVITTQFLRTRATAAPVASAAGITPVSLTAGADLEAHAQAIADTVRARSAGEVVLVVGHSNTIPAIIKALGGPGMPDLCESDYDNLFILELDAKPTPRLVRATFGAPDDAAAPACEGRVRR